MQLWASELLITADKHKELFWVPYSKGKIRTHMVVLHCLCVGLSWRFSATTVATDLKFGTVVEIFWFLLKIRSEMGGQYINWGNKVKSDIIWKGLVPTFQYCSYFNFGLYSFWFTTKNVRNDHSSPCLHPKFASGKIWNNWLLSLKYITGRIIRNSRHWRSFWEKQIELFVFSNMYIHISW